jgi:acyl-CoA synthetase (AMP-forming)/AMP-acid ligase II
MGLYDYGLYEIIKRNARVNRDRTALISGSQKISHGKFLANVDRLACGLRHIGLKEGDRVGVLALNSLEYVYLYGATAKTGIVMLPVNWRLSPQEMEYVISDGSPRVLFVGPEFHDTTLPLLSAFSSVEKCYSTGRDEGKFKGFDELMEDNGTCPETNPSSHAPYVIIHTAAVKGKPRGAVLSQRGLIYFNLQLMISLRLTEKDCNLGMLPLFHVGGLSTTLTVMQAGGTNIILPKFDADLALRHIQEDKVSLFGEFPPMLTTLLDKAQETNCDLSCLRAVIGLDQPDTVKRFQEVTGGTFWASYGQTETSGLVSLAPYFERPGSAGLPCFMSQVEIMDNYGNIMEPGVTGEIVVRGPMVFNGYWNLDKDNAYLFREGWHHTGDMGSFDTDGYLWYKGRKNEKELIKPGGENVYPAEVEKVILEHPMIEEVSVIGYPDKKWGEAIKAVCVLRKGCILKEEDLIEFVAARIARFKKPKYVVFVSSLPKSEDGAIDREEVKTVYSRAQYLQD